MAQKTKTVANFDEMFDENGQFIPQYARRIKASGEKGLCGLDMKIQKINESWQEVCCSGCGFITSVFEATKEEVIVSHCQKCRNNPLGRHR
jgi:hypothetical protein